jgi:hypothetical protein
LCPPNYCAKGADTGSVAKSNLIGSVAKKEPHLRCSRDYTSGSSGVSIVFWRDERIEWLI